MQEIWGPILAGNDSLLHLGQMSVTSSPMKCFENSDLFNDQARITRLCFQSSDTSLIAGERNLCLVRMVVSLFVNVVCTFVPYVPISN
jgi:hypothetical protein